MMKINFACIGTSLIVLLVSTACSSSGPKKKFSAGASAIRAADTDELLKVLDGKSEGEKEEAAEAYLNEEFLVTYDRNLEAIGKVFGDDAVEVEGFHLTQLYTSMQDARDALTDAGMDGSSQTNREILESLGIDPAVLTDKDEVRSAMLSLFGDYERRQASGSGSFEADENLNLTQASPAAKKAPAEPTCAQTVNRDSAKAAVAGGVGGAIATFAGCEILSMVTLQVEFTPTCVAALAGTAIGGMYSAKSMYNSYTCKDVVHAE